jgi:hypothetical protein
MAFPEISITVIEGTSWERPHGLWIRRKDVEFLDHMELAFDRQARVCGYLLDNHG